MKSIFNRIKEQVGAMANDKGSKDQLKLTKTGFEKDIATTD